MKYSIRPIAFRPEWVEELGDINSTLILQQLYYWQDRGKDKWIYKSISEMEYETTLSREKQDRAINKLIKNGYILKENRIVNGRKKRHFLVLKVPGVTEVNPKPKIEKPKEDDKPFNLLEEIQKAKQSPQRHIEIIGDYAEIVKNIRGLDIKTKDQWNIFLRRNMKAASQLAKFSNEQLSKAIEEVMDKHKDIAWTLETILKILTK